MMKKFIYIMNLILGFLLVGGTLFVAGNFSAETLKTGDFWWQLIGANIANLLFLTSTAKMDIDSKEKEDEDIKKSKEDIKEVVNSKVVEDFDDFISEENLKRKKTAWKDLINDKIAKFESRTSSKNRELYKGGTEEQKKKNRYCRKRKELSEKLKDDFINENIVFLKVKYTELKRYEITNGCNQKHTNYELTTNRSKRIVKDNSSRYVFSFALTLFASTFSDLFFKDFTYATLLVFVVKVMTLLYAIYSGKEYAKDFVNTTLKGDLQFRRDTLLRYLNWKLKNKEIKNNNDLVVIQNV